MLTKRERAVRWLIPKARSSHGVRLMVNAPPFEAGTASIISTRYCAAIRTYVDSTADYEFLRSYGAEIVFRQRVYGLTWVPVQTRRPFCLNEVTGPTVHCAGNNNFILILWPENTWVAGYSRSRGAIIQHYRLGRAIQRMKRYLWRQARICTFYNANCVCIRMTPFLIKIWIYRLADRATVIALPSAGDLQASGLQTGGCRVGTVPAWQPFQSEEKRNDFDYYEPDDHDSSLSLPYSVMASELGYYDKAYRYFYSSARMDP